MDFGQLVQVIRRAWLLILVFLVIGLASAVGYLRLTPAQYTARADVYVSIVGVQYASELTAASSFSQQQARNFGIMANRQRVLDPVIDQFGLDVTAAQLAGSVRGTVPANSSLISIEVTQSSPADAAAIANAVAASLGETAGKLLPPAKRGAPSISLQTVQRAEAPTAPSSPNTLPVLIIGIGGGLAVGLALALLFDAVRRSNRAAAPAPTAAHANATVAKRQPPQWDDVEGTQPAN